MHLEQTPPPSALLNYKQVAQILGCSEKTIWLLAKSGKLPACRIGLLVRFRPADVESFIRASQDLPAVTKPRTPKNDGRVVRPVL